MTCREKLKQEYPQYVRNLYFGGCYGCPSDFDYKVTPLCIGGKSAAYEICAACWDQKDNNSQEAETK